jgi:hypothetical protein
MWAPMSLYVNFVDVSYGSYLDSIAHSGYLPLSHPPLCLRASSPNIFMQLPVGSFMSLTHLLNKLYGV